jgi:hypothetical protein
MKAPPGRLVMRWRLALRDDDRPTSSAKLVGHTLSTYADNTTCSTFVGKATLARNCGFGVRTVYTAQKELERFGFLIIQPRVGLSNIYTLCLPRQPTARVPRQSTTPTPAAHCRVTPNNSDGGAANGSAPPFPLDDCAGCGRVLPLVKDGLYCEGCK